MGISCADPGGGVLQPNLAPLGAVLVFYLLPLACGFGPQTHWGLAALIRGGGPTTKPCTAGGGAGFLFAPARLRLWAADSQKQIKNLCR
jgi:hypothetical protein